MFLESEVILATMLKLMKRGVPSLPVHDSLIVRREDAESSKMCLEAEYESKIGIRPYVRVKD
jgi:hypothetical protein